MYIYVYFCVCIMQEMRKGKAGTSTIETSTIDTKSYPFTR